MQEREDRWCRRERIDGAGERIDGAGKRGLTVQEREDRQCRSLQERKLIDGAGES